MPKARLTDPITSHEAAESVGNLTATKQAILDLLKLPATDEELVNRYQSVVRLGLAPQASPSGIRSRRHELAEINLVKQIDYGKSAMGRKAIVWGLV
jgi:RNase adaptor protein for sRNA GlmZ degradation